MIADAHFLPHERQAHDYLDSLLESPPVQVFFMGDIFHLLIGHIPSSLKIHRRLLDKIHQLSQKTEVFYFEGNHDFALPQRLLPKVKIYPRALQPALFEYNGLKILLAHGDLFLSPLYEFYIRSMNCAPILSLMKMIDYLSFGLIYSIIFKKIAKKPIRPLSNAPGFAYDRLRSYTCCHQDFDVIIEGHFHASAQDPFYIAIAPYYFKKSHLCMTKSLFSAFMPS